MLRSLVGSEMCIRDRSLSLWGKPRTDGGAKAVRIQYEKENKSRIKFSLGTTPLRPCGAELGQSRCSLAENPDRGKHAKRGEEKREKEKREGEGRKTYNAVCLLPRLAANARRPAEATTTHGKPLVVALFLSAFASDFRLSAAGMIQIRVPPSPLVLFCDSVTQSSERLPIQ